MRHRKIRKGSVCVKHLCVIWDCKTGRLGLKKGKRRYKKVIVMKFNIEKKTCAVKRIRIPLDQSLDDTVYKWFCQLRSSGLAVRGIEIYYTLIDYWKKLLINEEVESGTVGLKTGDFYKTFHQYGENSATLEDIELWLVLDEDDLGYHILREEEVVENVIAAESSETDEYDKDEADDIINLKPKLSEIKDHLNIVIEYVEDKNDENISHITNI